MNYIRRIVEKCARRKDEKRRQAEADKLTAAQADTQLMIDAGIISTKQYNIVLDTDRKPGWYWKTPVIHIGAAARLATLYHLKIYGGICFGSIRAVLPRKRWAGMPPNNPTGAWCGWAERSTFQAAVCDCLMACHEQGILKHKGDVSI